MGEEYQNEKWRPLPDDPDYLISDLGRVKSLKQGKERILRPTNSTGYLTVNVWFGGVYRSVGVHRLVMAAFVGKQPDGKQVHHLDHNKANNRLDNLLYVTPKENAQAAIPFRRVAKQIKKQRQQEYIEQLRTAHETGQMSFELARQRLEQLGFQLSAISGVTDDPNTFDVTFSRPLNEEKLERLIYCGFYAYPKDLLSDDYRVTWWPD